MGRVTFSGPVKSNAGFELGSSGSGSNVAGTAVIGSDGSFVMAPSTSSTITIGTAVTGWNNNATVLAVKNATNVTMNCNSNSVFYISSNSAGTMSVTPVGGYRGQLVTMIWTPGSSTSIVFTSSSSLAVRLVNWAPNGTLNSIGQVTGWAGIAGSVNSINFINVGNGYETPTTQSVLMQITPAYQDHTGIY